MNAVRSVFFNFFYIFGSFAWSILLVWALAFPARICAKIISTIYGGYMNLIITHIMGIRLKLEGLEHLPKDTPYIIAAKHQSAYETLYIPFMKRLGYPVITMKKELTYLPIWGFYPRRMGFICIDRSQGAHAMRQMAEGAKKALADGRNIALFPQGTRVPVGAERPYKAGLAKLYKDLGIPIVPMALNSGVVWGRNRFFKKAGTVTFRFFPPIAPGMPPLKMMEELERVIEGESNALLKGHHGYTAKEMD